MTIVEELRGSPLQPGDADLAAAALRWSLRCDWTFMRDHLVSRLSPESAREVALAAAILVGAACARAGIPVTDVLPERAP